MPNWFRVLLLSIVLICMLRFFTGCVTGVGPSTVGVETKINNAQTSNTEAQKYNDLASKGASRIDAKATLILKDWDSAK